LKVSSKFSASSLDSASGIDRIGGVGALQEQALPPDTRLRTWQGSGNNSYPVGGSTALIQRLISEA
jgi:hypothetical protein